MTEPALGGQTATVIEQTRGQHNKRVDGASIAYPGCSLQPEPPSETTRDNRSSDTTRWRLFAPPGFRASASAVCTVTPGPENDDGSPLRLAFVGRAHAWPDETGGPHHVEAVVEVVGSS